jgi:benzodiazapine receptor
LRELASKGQLRLAYLRWAVVTVPFILLIGFTSARLLPTGSENRWYERLIKPDGVPPEWAFPIAWGAIYICLGLALAMIINARGSTMRGPAIIVFAVLMGGNFLWPLIFFGMHQVTWTLGLIAILLLLGLITLILFGRIRVGAGVLLLPYLAWVGYAGFLLYQIDQLNPNAESLVPSRSADQIQVN